MCAFSSALAASVVHQWQQVYSAHSRSSARQLSDPLSRILTLVAPKYGISDYNHQARQFCVPDGIRNYDFLIMMDRHNRDNVTLRTLLEKGKEAGSLTDDEENVPDPSRHGMPVFEERFEQKHIEDPAGSPMLMAPMESSDLE